MHCISTTLLLKIKQQYQKNNTINVLNAFYSINTFIQKKKKAGMNSIINENKANIWNKDFGPFLVQDNR